MRVLITGRGTSGSWQVRGEQLGRAIGATVRPNASSLVMADHDVVVLVKRPTPELAAALRACGRPVVWDCVDSWPQPAGNALPRDRAVAHIRAIAAGIGARAIVAATPTMAVDVGSRHWLQHHGWDRGAARTREQVVLVGYEGDPRYLGRWRRHIEAECARRRWQFVVNPTDYLLCDIVVAFRDGEFDGYAPRHWKSNVKLANAQIAGIPFIGAREDGYLATASLAEHFCDTVHDLREGFERFEDAGERAIAASKMRAAAPRLPGVAQQYRDMLAWIAK